MIEALHDLAVQNVFQPLQIVDHSRHRVGLAFEGHLQEEVVTVPVGVGFGAVESLVLRVSQRRVAAHVRRGEPGPAGDQHTDTLEL